MQVPTQLYIRILEWNSKRKCQEFLKTSEKEIMSSWFYWENQG